MKTKLFELSKNLSSDFKSPNLEIDKYLGTLEPKKFEKVYDTILKIKNKSKETYSRLYAYFYYHYC